MGSDPVVNEPSITVYRSGPYLVRGDVRLVDEDGSELILRRAIVPLCRCGRSRTKPLCDGSHGAAVVAAGEARDETSPPAG
jgi:CDGSH-type Zn-finger protein